jgi:hypothetical protein
MQDSPAIATVAGLVTLGAAAAVFFSRPGALPPGIDPHPHQAVGTVLAQQALRLLQPGGQLILIVRDTAAFPNPASDIQLASFKRTIRTANAPITSILALQVDPLRPVEVPPGDFFELIKKTPKGSVIVSFMGPPLLSPEQCLRLKEIKPAIVAFCSGNLPQRLNLKAFFEQGLLHAAVVSRHAPLATPPSQGLQGWFDQSFLAITPSNLAMLATARDAQ